MLPALFHTMPSEFRQELSFGKDEAIFRMEAPTTGMYFLVEGEVHLVRYTMAGDKVILHRARASSFFAEASLFSDRYHCDAIAVAPCKLVKFLKQETVTWLSANPTKAMVFSAYLAKAVQDNRRLLELRSIKSAGERVFAGVADGWLDGSVISFASQIGLTHEATYRALSELVVLGKLKKTSRGTYSLPEGFNET